MNGSSQQNFEKGGTRPSNEVYNVSRKVRVPTVNEALPFTPFASIIPFDAGLIASPSITSLKAGSIATLNDNAFRASRKLLDQLGEGVTRVEDASERCQKTISDVQKMIQSTHSDYFKSNKPASRQSYTKSTVKTVKLSNFAKVVFDGLDLESKVKSELDSKAPPSAVSLANGHSKHQPQQANVARSKTQQRSLPPQSTAIASNVVKHSHHIQVVQTQRPASTANTNIHIIHRNKSDVAVSTVLGLIKDILDAEDVILAGDQLDNDVLAIFRCQDTEQGSQHLLSSAYQIRLDDAIHKCAAAGRLDSIPTDDLKRLEKICETVISLSAGVSLQLQDDWSGSEIEDWQQLLHTIESSLLGTRTLLKVMSAASAERELQSEDLVQQMLIVIRTVAESGIVSVVELRNVNKDNGRFSIAQDNHDQLSIILKTFTRVIRSLGGLLEKIKVDESAISTIIYTCKILVFAENATLERDAVLGVQDFETSRRHAMDVLARIFDKYPEQRHSIFSEILLSLEKLPATKQSARQYRIADARPIQLVSALIMQLVQTSATRGGARVSTIEGRDARGESSSDEQDDEDSDEDQADATISQLTTLRTLIAPLEQAVQSNIHFVTSILVQRALNTAKSSDDPHRKLLDIFTEDFFTVLGRPEWPAAELLLRALLLQMIAIAEKPKNTGQARTFAIESLGNIAAGILQLQHRVRDQTGSLMHSDNAAHAQLYETVTRVLSNNVDADEVAQLHGPYRAIIESLRSKRNEGGQAHTAIGCHLLQWCQQACAMREQSTEPTDEKAASRSLFSSLKDMLTNKLWFETHIAFEAITFAEGRLATMCITSISPLCKAINRIVKVLVFGLDSDQSLVKSRAIRSVAQLVESDPDILDRNSSVLSRVLYCMEDTSPLVRETALGLITKCMALRPQLDIKIVDYIIKRTGDAAVGARKRSLKMLKDMYLRNDSVSMRSNIATAIVHCITDVEESIVDLANQTIEEIWFQPLIFAPLQSRSETAISMLYKAQASLMVATVESDDAVPEALVTIFRSLLEDSKNCKENMAVSRNLIEVLYGGFTDPKEFSDALTQPMFLQVLAVFAQAVPKIMTPSQLELLEPYTKNLQSNEDLTIFQLAVSILRHAMPRTVGLKKQFLTNLQRCLMGSLVKLPHNQYPEVAACLWTIDGELHNTEALVKIVSSAVLEVRKIASQNVDSDAATKKLVRYMHLAGQFGKACDLEAQLAKVKSHVPGTKSTTVAGIIIESLTLFAGRSVSVQRRRACLECICAVCQRWPKEFLRPDVAAFFDSVLAERLPELEDVLLQGLLTFFGGQEVAMPANSDAELESGRERLAKTYAATDQDGATASLSQRYLTHIVRLATSSTGGNALTATRLMASIVRQGLPHPKECGPSLIALETSPNLAIAEIACAEHRTLHEKHETIIEKEYMRAMSQALSYQETVGRDPRGWTGQPPSAKLHFFWDVLKRGKAKVRQKFITNICARLVFEPNALEIRDQSCTQLAFTRFIVENIALFDLDKAEDVRLLLDSLAKTFAIVGTSLAQMIDTEVFNMTVDNLGSSQLGSQVVESQATGPRLQQLAISAQILLLVAEARAFLVRVWGGQKQAKKDRSAKDTAKAAIKSANNVALAEAFVKKTGSLCEPRLDQESQEQVCRAFTEVVSTDHEVKVGTDDEDDGDDDSDIRSPSAAIGTPSGRKRKSSIQGAGPRKRGRPRKTPSFNRVDEDADADGEWE